MILTNLFLRMLKRFLINESAYFRTKTPILKNLSVCYMFIFSLFLKTISKKFKVSNIFKYISFIQYFFGAAKFVDLSGKIPRSLLGISDESTQLSNEEQHNFNLGSFSYVLIPHHTYYILIPHYTFHVRIQSIFSTIQNIHYIIDPLSKGFNQHQWSKLWYLHVCIQNLHKIRQKSAYLTKCRERE